MGHGADLPVAVASARVRQVLRTDLTTVRTPLATLVSDGVRQIDLLTDEFLNRGTSRALTSANDSFDVSLSCAVPVVVAGDSPLEELVARPTTQLTRRDG